jgi:hypothetical protein
VPVGISFTSATAAEQRRTASSDQTGAERSASGAPTPLATAPRSAGVVINGDSRGDLNSTQGPATVIVTNSTDLNALAEAVTLAALGEHVTIAGSTFAAGAGAGGLAIDLGTIHERTLTLQDSTFSADVIKARSFGTGGKDSLIISGSTFNAAQLIRLYADGDSTLRFRGDVRLNSPTSDIAGSRVTIDAGSTVTASGNVRVFTDAADFDTPGRGSLHAAGSKTVQPFAERPRRF